MSSPSIPSTSPRHTFPKSTLEDLAEIIFLQEFPSFRHQCDGTVTLDMLTHFKAVCAEEAERCARTMLVMPQTLRERLQQMQRDDPESVQMYLVHQMMVAEEMVVVGFKGEGDLMEGVGSSSTTTTTSTTSQCADVWSDDYNSPTEEEIQRAIDPLGFGPNWGGARKENQHPVRNVLRLPADYKRDFERLWDMEDAMDNMEI